MTALNKAAEFIANTKTHAVIKTAGYVHATIPNTWDTYRITDFLKQEVRYLNAPKTALLNGKSVSIYVINPDTFHVLHLQVKGVGEAQTWAVIE